MEIMGHQYAANGSDRLFGRDVAHVAQDLPDIRSNCGSGLEFNHDRNAGLITCRDVNKARLNLALGSAIHDGQAGFQLRDLFPQGGLQIPLKANSLAFFLIGRRERIHRERIHRERIHREWIHRERTGFVWKR